MMIIVELLLLILMLSFLRRGVKLLLSRMKEVAFPIVFVVDGFSRDLLYSSSTKSF